MSFREAGQNKYVQGMREEHCIEDEKKYHNVIEKSHDPRDYHKPQRNSSHHCQTARDDVSKNMSVVYGTINFQF